MRVIERTECVERLREIKDYIEGIMLLKELQESNNYLLSVTKYSLFFGIDEYSTSNRQLFSVYYTRQFEKYVIYPTSSHVQNFLEANMFVSGDIEKIIAKLG